MPVLPTSLALTVIADGSLAVAADERNNFSSVQTGVNGLISCLTGGAAGQFASTVGTTVVPAYPPGFEIGYDQITAPVTVSSVTEATGTTVIAGSSHTFDGAPVIAEVFAPSIATAAALGAFVVVSLFEGAAQIGRLGSAIDPAAQAFNVPFYARYRFTPSAASHTYSVTAFQSGGNGSIGAGVAGTGVTVPAFLRFSKV